VIADAGWLRKGSAPHERLAESNVVTDADNPAYKRVLESIFALEAFHRLAHHPALVRIMEMLAGPRLLIHPRPIPRIIFPNAEHFVTHAHQDNQGIGGDAESFTLWTPLHDCPVELGPLRILEASHLYGWQPTVSNSGWTDKERMQGGAWASGAINAGDVLIFHSLAIHEATPNSSEQIRLSLDCRFQDYVRPIDPGNLVATGKTSPSWDEVYAGWHSTELQYYWQSLPLRLKPDLTELAELARTAEPERMRMRYRRILERMQTQFAVKSH
jgi:Phytanoyl-CoA dioxygenase (PhyH)